MKQPLLTRGMPGRGTVLLFDDSLASPTDERAATYLTLHACNTGTTEASCALLLEGAGMSVRAPIIVPPLGALGAPRPVVRRFPAMRGDVVRWEAPDGVVVLGFVEANPNAGAQIPEALTASRAHYDDVVEADEREVHRFRVGEQLTLGVDVPAGETLELIFRPEDGDELRVQLAGPLVAYELYDGVPMGASGTLAARVVSGGAAVVYGCLVRS